MSGSLADLKSIFGNALALGAPEERKAYLDRACGGDAALRAEVESLLEASAGAGHFLAAPAATVDEPPTSEGVGASIGPYKLLAWIGDGGMGTVWMAQQTAPVKRLVAVKRIKAGMDSKHVIARFEAERQALALMDHPNIARVLDGGTTDAGRPYFVMDLVKGVPITKYCDEHCLTPRQRLELFVPVCQAVQHAHQKGIIHRDLKPSNALVALYDGKPVPKVIDFGVAKATGQQLTDKTLVTGIGAIVGTLEYMSPEQAEVNQLDIDTRSDIYSLGVLLYELLTGSPPFTRKEMEKAGMLEMLRVIREEEPPKPSTKLSTAEGLPTLAANRGMEPAQLTKLFRGELDWIVMKALEKDRNRRYETANGLAMDVQRYLNDETVQACPPSTWYRTRKFARRNKVGLAVAGLVLFFVALLGGGAGWVLHDRSNRRSVTAEQVNQALRESENLYRRGKLPEALVAARESRTLLEQGGGSEALWQRVRGRLADMEMAGRLDDARLAGTATSAQSRYVFEVAARTYAEAFRNYGIDVLTLEPAEAAERIRRQDIREDLTVALDNWASLPIVDLKVKQRLTTIATAADADAWRRQMRAAAGEKGQTLKKVAASPEVLGQSPSTLILLSTYLHNQGESHAAVQLMRDAQQRHPDDFWINERLAYFLSDAIPQQRDEVLRFQTAAVALRPHSPEARLKLGMILDRKGLPDEAIASFQEAIRLKPDYVSAHYIYGKLLLTAKSDLEGAIVMYSRVIELDPKFVWGWFDRGGAYRALARLDMALADFSQAIELSPNNAVLWSNRAETYLALGQQDKALADFSKAVELKEDYSPAWNGRGNAYLALGQFEKAIADFSRVLELDPTNRETRLARANAHQQLRQWDNAIADFTTAFDGKTVTISAWSGRGRVYAESGRWKEAAADFAKMVASEPTQPAFWDHLATAYLAGGDTEAYRRVCADLLERFQKTKDPEIASRVASTCVAAPEAVADAAQLVALAELACSGNRTGNVGLLGAAYCREGRAAMAMKCFHEKAKVHPLRAWDLFFMAMAHRNLGQAKEARECLTRAVQWLAVVGPPGPDEVGKPGPKWFNWQEEVVVRFLRREAEGLLKK